MSLKDGRMTLPGKFMGSMDSYLTANIVLVGVPMDFTCSFRPGTRFGPQKIREVSYGIEDYSFYQNESVERKNYFDCGDLDLPIGNVEESLNIIKIAAEEIFKDNKKPIFLGGEHTISVPIIESAYNIYGSELILVHLDAHADFREDYLGVKNSHASAIRRASQFVSPSNIYQFGIRSGTKDEFEYCTLNTNFYPFEVYEPLKSVFNKFKDKPIYLTLDIDVVDPAFANGTGTPEPGGITTKELLDTLLLFKDSNIIGFDVVEISPPYDTSDRTAVLGAKIVREMILMMDK